MQTSGNAVQNPSLAFLAGDGEMVARTREFDWSKTPVGPAADWPQSLKTVVRIMLDSRYAMWLGWGPDFTFFYNDAYASMTLGPKHPWALGRSAREVWSEIWSDIGPRAESVIETGQATWDEGLLLFLERQGFPEETYHTFSYSPVPGDQGAIGGMLCVVTEDTERTLGERRLRVLRELSVRTTERTTSDVDACRTAARTLASHSYDLPFALLYLLDEEEREAHLAGAAGLESGSTSSPLRVAINSQSPWPFRQVMEQGCAVDVPDLVTRLGQFSGGPWPESPRQAVVLPIAAPGQSRLAGFLVAGVSPRLVLTDDYRGFLDLLTGQLASVVANARASAEEQRRAEALAELNRAKTDFFSNVSHEFRTPLTLMLGPLEDLLLKSNEKLPSAARSSLDVVNRNGLRLLRLVNSLLDFSRIEAGRVTASFEPTDLSALTIDLVSGFRAACEQAGLRLVLDCPPLAEPVYVDREMWEKIVLNLVSNAFKFTFEGEIAVSLALYDEEVQLQVRDTGTGVPAEAIPRLFERFYRVQNARSRSHEGSGIGLALVQELVRLHGGTIRAESTPGRGTTFTIQMPLGKSHLPEDQVADPRALESTPDAANPFVQEALRWLPGAADDEAVPDSTTVIRDDVVSSDQAGDDQFADRPVVLVADDNADMREYIGRLLADQFTVKTVADGVAALEAIRASLPDLLLTDVMMPRLSGFELINKLRSDPATSSLPIIVLSARAGEESRVEGIQSGADDYLVKPFSARELLARVTAHLQMSRLRREASESVRRSDERLQMALAAARMVTWQYDPATRQLELSETAADVIGLPRGCTHISSDDAVAMIAPSDVEGHQDRVRVAVHEQGSYLSQYRLVRPDNGGVVLLEERGQTIGDSSNGEMRLVGVTMDVTAARQGEERVRLLWEAAAVMLTTDEPDVMLRRLFDKIGPNLQLDTYFNFMVDDAGACLRLASCTGIPEDVARSISRLEFGQAICGNVALLRQPIIATFIQQSDDPKVSLVKTMGIRAYACNPLLAGSQLLGTLSFASRTRDRFDPEELDFLQTICQYVTAAYERLRLINQLREADRRKDEFLATLAHELRNPLAPLSNGLEILRHTAGMTATDEVRAVMERQLAQMVHLVDDLLDMSRISRGKINLRHEHIELGEVIRQAIETSRPVIERARHRLTISLPPASLIVNGDSTRLAQVFSNLLNNAAKYSDAGGQITVTVEHDASQAVVKVRDTGIGIPVEMLPRVFEMFTQVDRSLEKSQGGLGIGLSLVKGLVEMHGGSVQALSPGRGHGSEFVVRLPVVESQEGVNFRRPGETRFATPANRRILIVDDNRDAANSLAMMLRLMGNDTAIAHDGLQALDVAAAFRPDVALLDIGMPRLNGYDTAMQMRKESWGQDILLVALTGWGQEDDKRRTQEAGFNHHLVKPLDFAVLDKLLAGLHIIKVPLPMTNGSQAGE